VTDLRSVRARRGRLALLLSLVLLACTKEHTAKRSTELASAKARVDWLCEYALCPTRPLDAAFDIAPGDEGAIVHAVVKVDPADVPRWSMGCDDLAAEARPKWLGEVLAPTGWTVKTIPDTWRCGGEQRVIHVKEAVILRALRSHRP
jgi:hypothetical protein